MFKTHDNFKNSIKILTGRVKTRSYGNLVSRIWHWSKLVSFTSAAQTVVQAVGFLSGLIIIRFLPIEQYAYYTIVNTVLGTMLVLADAGISTGVTSLYGKDYNSKGKSGAILVSGLELRKKSAIISGVIGVPFLIFLLNHHNASWLTIFLLIIAIFPGFYSSLSVKYFEIPLLLHGKVFPLQKNQLQVNISRLFLLIITIFVFPWAFIAIISSGIPQIWGNKNLKKISTDFVFWKAKPDPKIKKELLVFLRKLLPGSIYYCFSGQITLWLISIFGSTETIAQLGALGRLAMILTIIAAVFNTLAVPAFVKLQNNRNNLLIKYGLILLALIVASASILLLFKFFPTQFLWLLGDGYSGLEYELVLFITSSCFELMLGIFFVLNSSRGWLINPYLNMVVGILSIIIGILIFDISSLQGILYFKLLTSITAFFYFLSYGLFKISQVPNFKYS